MGINASVGSWWGQWRVAVVVMGMGSLWVYGGGYGFGPNLCCVAVGLWACVCCSGSRGGWWWQFVLD